METIITSSAHTPGPWHFGRRLPAPRRYGTGEEFYIYTKKGDVAVVPPFSAYSVREAEVNVHLVTAAPELLEALNHAYLRLNQIRHAYNRTDFKMIESALAKAEGR